MDKRRRPLDTATCSRCGDTFTRFVDWREQRYCSRACGRQKDSGWRIHRFWNKVEKTPTCWLWTGYRQRDGYGKLTVAGRSVRAPRYSWEITNGPIPDGMQVCHHCDNPPCVRPDHLFLGTGRANAADRNSKNRQALGERNRNARLTEPLVLELRELHRVGHGSAELARRFGLGEDAVRFAVTGRTWRHIA